jgi:hypothetical protein
VNVLLTKEGNLSYNSLIFEKILISEVLNSETPGTCPVPLIVQPCEATQSVKYLNDLVDLINQRVRPQPTLHSLSLFFCLISRPPPL